MSENDGSGKRQLRLLGVGTGVAGLLVLAGALSAADLQRELVYLLGFLGVAALVLEYTQGATPGVSLGLLTGGLILWIAPYVGVDDPLFVGALLVLIGVVNTVGAGVSLYFRRLGERLGERVAPDAGEEE